MMISKATLTAGLLNDGQIFNLLLLLLGQDKRSLIYSAVTVID